MVLKKSVCPPGVFCITPGLGIVLLIVLCIGMYLYFEGIPSKVQPPRYENEESQQNTIINNVVQGGDDRYTRAPEPLRSWMTIPDLRGALIPAGAVPINVNPRGIPSAYQQMGYIKTDGEKLLPLYGRQTAYRSDRFNYYTRTDTYNPIQVPITFKKKNCSDDIGCEELFGGEEVHVKGVGQSGTVDIYKFDGPTYIPGLV